jgi:hypothetical protein
MPVTYVCGKHQHWAFGREIWREGESSVETKGRVVNDHSLGNCTPNKKIIHDK